MKNKLLGIFLVPFFCYVWFLTPNVNTGDAGELITASYFLGNAHPSGYPLYLILGKMVSFIPIGNLGFRLAIISALFGSLTLCGVFYVVNRNSTELSASIFSVLTLGTCYSFFTQSVIAKFYTLNAFLVILIVIMSIKLIRLEDCAMYNSSYLYAICFVLGLGTANHHTILLITPALLIVVFLMRNEIKLITVFFSIVAFAMGFVVNIFILFRGVEGNYFSSAYVRDLQDAIRVFLRTDYREGSTLSAPRYLIARPLEYLLALRNFIFIVVKNLGAFSAILCLIGVTVMLIKKRREGLFLAAALLFYGPLLVKLTMAPAGISEMDFYIAAHQYFLPALVISSIFLGLGFAWLTSVIDRMKFRYAGKIIPWLLCAIPLINMLPRSVDSNYRTNFVPYQVIKESFSLLPVNSVFIAYGDNPIYQSWYIKILGRYREDVCQLSASEQESPTFAYQGCSHRVYGNLYPEVYEGRIKAMDSMADKGRFFTSDPLHDYFYFKNHIRGKPLSLFTGLIRRCPDATDTKCQDHYPPNFDRIMALSDLILNPTVCLEHQTDDLYTRGLCSKYVTYLVYSSKEFSASEYESLNKQVTLSMPLLHNNIKKGEIRETVDVTKGNVDRLMMAAKLSEYNNWKILYMRD